LADEQKKDPNFIDMTMPPPKKIHLPPLVIEKPGGPLPFQVNSNSNIIFFSEKLLTFLYNTKLTDSSLPTKTIACGLAVIRQQVQALEVVKVVHLCAWHL
jgi:hypothetical protein